MAPEFLQRSPDSHYAAFDTGKFPKFPQRRVRILIDQLLQLLQILPLERSLPPSSMRLGSQGAGFSSLPQKFLYPRNADVENLGDFWLCPDLLVVGVYDPFSQV
jgi:hypothetical protein